MASELHDGGPRWRPLGADVAQVMEADVGASDLVARLVVARGMAVHLSWRERLPVDSAEHQRVGAGRRLGRQVMAHVGDDV